MFNKFADLTQKLSPNLRKIVGNTAWLFAERFLQMGLGLLVGVWVARYLGPTQFGLFNYAVAFVGLLTPLATLGLNHIVVRDLTRDPSCQAETLGTAFWLKFFGGFLTFFVSMGMVMLSNPQNDLTVWLVAIEATGRIFLCFEVIDFWFQSIVESKYTVISKNAAYVLINVVKIALIQIRAPLIAFSGALTLEKAMAALALVITYRLKKNFILAWRFSLTRAKELLQQSWPLILTSFIIGIYMRIDQVMLGQMNKSEELGLYSAAVKISEMWYFIPSALVQSVFPSIVQAKEISETLYYERIQKLLNFLTLVSYAVAIPITFLADPIMTILYGENYRASGSSLAVLIWTGLFVSAGLARTPWLITENLMKFAAATTAVGAGINVVLNFILIPSYGGLGAGIATLIAQMFAAYGSNAFYPKTRKFFIKQTQAIFLIDLLRQAQLRLRR